MAFGQEGGASGHEPQQASSSGIGVAGINCSNKRYSTDRVIMDTSSFDPMPYAIVLHEAHELSELVSERLRFLKKRYGFPQALVERLEQAGIDVTDKGCRLG